MSFAKQAASLAFVGLVFSSGLAFAQAGGGDVPTNAKKQGEKEMPGSTGGSGNAMKASPSSGDNKATATGGQPGGGAGKN